MRGKEIILLDARVVGVLAQSVFRAKLANGHEIVAYADRADRGRVAGVRTGNRVRVELSPYDMSQGRIVLDEEFEDEGQKLSQENM